MDKKYFGSIGNDSVYEYQLRNAKGMRVSITSYGGTVTKIVVPDKNQQMGDVVLGFAGWKNVHACPE